MTFGKYTDEAVTRDGSTNMLDKTLKRNGCRQGSSARLCRSRSRCAKPIYKYIYEKEHTGERNIITNYIYIYIYKR